MIRKPTLLIFGAGVSFEYGFPLGRSLLLKIVADLEFGSRLCQMMKSLGFTFSAIDQFRRELGLSGQPSVDAFLEQHKKDEQLGKLGKTAIAASLIPSEDEARLNDRSAIRLYEYLWHQISGSPNMYSANQLSIITFNYDRSFEQYLRTVLTASHPEFRDQCNGFNAALSQFDVIHIFGSLGSLETKSSTYLPYGLQGAPNSVTIEQAAARIKLYHEAQFDDDTSNRIRLRITEAETICFLGFGFHPINIRLLEFCGLGENKDTHHYASAFGLKPGERKSILERVKFDITFANEQATSLEALRSLPVLTTS